MKAIPEGRTRAAGFFESRRAVALLLAVSAVVFAAISLRPVTHSEVRYVEAGAEMARSGDWVVPHLSFVPYFEKPILTYWFEAAAQVVFGAGAIAVRLPSILAALAIVATTYAMGRALRGPVFGLGAAAILASSVMFQEVGTSITTDPLFSAFLVGAWYAFWRHDRAPKSGWIWVFWTLLGLGFMTKGPLGPALVGSTIGAYLLLAGRFRDFLRMHPVRGAAVIAAINLPWSVLVWQRDPRFLQFFYIRENFQAFTDGAINHAHPPWYYLEFVPIALFPLGLLGAWAIGAEIWTPFAPAVRRLLRRSDAPPAPDASRLYLACMVLPPFLLLSAAGSKLGTYILPLVPAMALLLAAYVADRLANPTWAMRWTLPAQSVLFALAALLLPFAADGLPEDWSAILRREGWTIAAAGAALIVPMLAGGVWMVRGRTIRGIAATVLGSLAFVLIVNPFAEDLGADRLAGGLVQQMCAIRMPGERVVVAGAMIDDYTVVLGLKERVYVWGAARELGMGHFTEVKTPDVPLPLNPYDVSVHGGVNGDGAVPQNPWLFDDERLRAAWTGPGRVWFVGRAKDIARLRALPLAVYLMAEKDTNAVATNRPL